MVGLAEQLIARQSGRYDPSDLEDRYETRLREMIDAKLKGEGVEAQEVEAPRDNVIDLMAALKESLGQVPAPKRTAKKKANDMRQGGLKLPIKGGKTASTKAKAAEPVSKVKVPARPAKKRA
jgi:DNA end-binding protein Ku